MAAISRIILNHLGWMVCEECHHNTQTEEPRKHWKKKYRKEWKQKRNVEWKSNHCLLCLLVLMKQDKRNIIVQKRKGNNCQCHH